ncbi:MAG: hypothetical protein B7Z55_11055 [Planctomycetales bacterium 12-60-4]|nr:MAG: hypothetical protein B7Z55_11055 [Planctomycetales bacterium 12-60-4]
MFDSIRNHKKYLMGFLMVLIIPSFIFVGIEGYTNFDRSGEAVATVDGKDITQVDWDQAHQLALRRLTRHHDMATALQLEVHEAPQPQVHPALRLLLLPMAVRAVCLHNGPHVFFKREHAVRAANGHGEGAKENSRRQLHQGDKPTPPVRPFLRGITPPPL